MSAWRRRPSAAAKPARKRHVAKNSCAEAEVREILVVAVMPETRVRLGDAQAALGKVIGLTNDDAEALNQARDWTPAQPLVFK